MESRTLRTFSRSLAYLLLIPALIEAQEKPDLSVINRIKSEAFGASTIMDTTFYLSDVYGPRLTGSPALKEAATWTMDRMREFGISNPHLETWPFGKRWTNVNFSAKLRKPQYATFIGMARPWARSTNGLVTGEPVLAPIRSVDDFAKYQAKLKGRIVMLEEPRTLQTMSVPLMSRFSDGDLTSLAESPQPGRGNRRPDSSARIRFRNALSAFLNKEGVILTITTSLTSARSDPSTPIEGGTIFSTYAGSPESDQPLSPPAAAIAAEDYNRIARLLQHRIPVTVEFEIQNEYSENTVNSFSIIGEIPGTSKADEIVMLGAHLDSVSFATGATDNAAGCAVVLEVMRILKGLDLKMKRTVRVALWTGEEQGYGSLPYVTQHFANAETMSLKPEHSKISGYFNLDNGTGKIRGVYLQNNDMMRPIFESWLAPFRDLGVTTLSIVSKFGSDQVPFDDVGIPAFQFIQDPIEYETRTHHSNMDVYDRLQPSDLMQAAAVMASVVYQTANHDDMLPRKSLPTRAAALPNKN
jgi:hypothetical protein